jgi:hypothetical protein
MRVDQLTGWLVFSTEKEAENQIVGKMNKRVRPNYCIVYDDRVSGYVVRAVTDSGEGEGETI